jgi:tetratricopeptide (TPR) repeat protein
MAHDVFVSHSAKDKPTADAVCAVLESQGIRCWVAPRDIVPGKDWGESIIDAITGARVMVLIFSTHANDSHQIKREVERAVNKGIPVIPLRIEDITPTKALEYFLSTPHWLDAFTPPLEKHLEYLAQIIRAIVEGTHAEVLSAPTAEREGKKKSGTAEAVKLKSPVMTAQRVTDSTSQKEKTGKIIWIVTGASVVLLALLILILGGWFGTKPSHPESAQRQIQAGSTPQTNPPVVTTNVVTTTPLIPEEARKHFVMGTTLFKDAKTADDFLQVESEFKQAADLAPQWPEARSNLALAREAADDYSGAMDDWKLYQSFKLSDTEARTVQDKIYSLEARQQVKEADEKKAAEEKAKTEAEAAKQAEEKRQADVLAAQKAAEEKAHQEEDARLALEKQKQEAERQRQLKITDGLNAAQVALLGGKFTDARQQYQAVLALDDGNAQAKTGLADVDKAEKAAEETAASAAKAKKLRSAKKFAGTWKGTVDYPNLFVGGIQDCTVVIDDAEAHANTWLEKTIGQANNRKTVVNGNVISWKVGWFAEGLFTMTVAADGQSASLSMDTPSGTGFGTLKKQ